MNTFMRTFGAAGLMATLMLGLSGHAANAAAPAIQVGAQYATVAADPAVARKVALARKLLELQGFTAQLQKAFDQLEPLMQQMMRSDPNIAALPLADRTKLGEYMISELRASAPVMIDKYAGYFATNLSEPELVELVAIYQRPSMVKVTKLTLDAQDALAADMNQVGQEAALRAVNKYITWKKSQPR